MGLISDLFGTVRASGAKHVRRTIADVEAALARLAAERKTARAAVAEAMRQRDELLLVDETDEKIAGLDTLADHHRLTSERVEKLEPILLAELQELRSEAKRVRWSALRTQYDTAALDYARTVRDAIQKMAVMLNLNDEARREGFEREVMALFIPPMRVLTIDELNRFESEIERAREANAPKAAPSRPAAPKAAAPRPAADRNASGQLPQMRDQFAGPVAPTAPKPAPAPAPKAPTNRPRAAQPAAPREFKPPQPDENGAVAIVVIRPGLEIEGRDRPRAGETIRVPATQAAAIVRSGNADFAEAS